MNNQIESNKSLFVSDIIWICVTILLAIAVYIPTFADFWSKYHTNSQYSLAPLVLIVAGYFIYRKWAEVKKLNRNPNIWGLVLMIFALFMHIIGRTLDITGPSGVSVLIFSIGMLIYYHSLQFVKTLAFPLAYLIFMIPLPGGLIDMVGFPLQLYASAGTTVLLKAMGIDVVRSGVDVAVPGFKFQVAIACSGMSSLVALISVTAVLAYISRVSTVYKWILFGMSLPVALAANVVRITTIALVGYQLGSDVAIKIYHDWSSPILFVAAISLMILLSWFFEKISERKNKKN